MARYVLDNELWEIHQDGTRLVIVTGGKETIRTFLSAEHAQAQLQRFVDDKRAQGYQPVTVPAVDDSRQRAALEAAIAADPYDATAYSVYGEWLESHGDPRGRLIQLQLAAEANPEDAALAEASRKYLVAHGPELADGLAKYQRGLRWRFGFIHRLELELYVVESIRTVLAHASGRFVAEIAIGDRPATVARALSLLRPMPATLRRLELTSAGEIDDRGIIGSLVGLRALTMRAGGRDGVLTRPCVSSLAHAPSSLGSLAIHFGGPERYGELRPLFVRTDLALELLELRGSSFANQICRALVDSPLAATLVTLDLAWSDISDDSLQLLVQHRDRFPRLRELGVTSDRVSATPLAALRNVIDRVVDVPPEARTSDFYDSIRE